MNDIFELLGLVNLVAIIGLLVWARQLRRQANTLRASAHALGTAQPPLPEKFRRDIAADGLIGVRVLNPMELAARQSRIGKAFAGMAAGLIRREVMKRVASSLRDELAAQGVVAEVRIYRD